MTKSFIERVSKLLTNFNTEQLEDIVQHTKTELLNEKGVVTEAGSYRNYEKIANSLDLITTKSDSKNHEKSLLEALSKISEESKELGAEDIASTLCINALTLRQAIHIRPGQETATDAKLVLDESARQQFFEEYISKTAEFPKTFQSKLALLINPEGKIDSLNTEAQLSSDADLIEEKEARASFLRINQESELAKSYNKVATAAEIRENINQAITETDLKAATIIAGRASGASIDSVGSDPKVRADSPRLSIESEGSEPAVKKFSITEGMADKIIEDKRKALAKEIEEIRKTFNMSAHLTPEELNKVRKQQQKAFEQKRLEERNKEIASLATSDATRKNLPPKDRAKIEARRGINEPAEFNKNILLGEENIAVATFSSAVLRNNSTSSKEGPFNAPPKPITKPGKVR